MRYKISYFSQSHSRLYLRNVSRSSADLFDCLIFIGTHRINLSDVFDFDQMYVTRSNDGVHKEFDFGGEQKNTVEALSVEFAKVRDFPEVPIVEVVGSSDQIDDDSWPLLGD